MPESFLSFANSATFRNSLLTRNLPPYTVTGVYTPPNPNIDTETQLSVSNVIDSPNELISDSPFSDDLYPLNKYGPDGGYNNQINYNQPPLPVQSNSGEYDPNDTQLDLVNEFFIDAAYIENKFGPIGGFQNMITITDIQLNTKVYAPYWDPPTFVPSSYSPYQILISDNPTGSSGLLSQDSFIAQLGAKNLQQLFKDRVAAEIYQNTVGSVAIESLTDPFNASLLITGKQPFFVRNWRITVPEFPVTRLLDFSTRLAGAYWPVSFIPGDYFQENLPNGQSKQTQNALNVINQLTGGFLGPILNLKRSPSEIFIANTGNGQRSVLFHNLDYNRYQPGYPKNFGGILGIAQAVVNLAVSLINPNGTLVGGYYVGSKNAEPSSITSPPNQVPINAFGQQQQVPVYGPSEMGILFEGNSAQLNFGLQAKSLTDGGALDGEFVWVSPKFKSNAGFKPTPGGGTGSLDSQFNQISSNYTRDESTNLTFKETSILDETQRLINSADNVQGISRLKHVGNAINQVSKVFNDGYKEMTKGSQVVSYIDNTTGGEKGIEYCRVFAKDTPYYTYSDLQKTDGITNKNRGFTNSVLDNTYNLNIAPMRGEGSTNLQKNAQGNIVAKKYMFSIENLAWRTSSRPGFTYDELPDCEKGPNGGRVMWFPPYNLKFSDSSTANWNPTHFLGRPEPMYTYKDTSRNGTLNWTIIVDNPSVLNVIVEQQLKGQNKERLNSIIDSFFAGCVKFDIYDLAKKYNQIPTQDLKTIQEILNNPDIKPEQLEKVKSEIPAEAPVETQNNIQGGADKKITPDTSVEDIKVYQELAFYFDNDRPDPNTNNTTTQSSFDELYNTYIGTKDNYQTQADSLFDSNTNFCKKNASYCNDNKGVKNFFDIVIIDNYNKINSNQKSFINDAEKILKENGTITIELQSSASAIAQPKYNENLSKRRTDSIIKFFQKSKIGKYLSSDNEFGQPTFFIKSENLGETAVIPQVSGGSTGFDVNCTKNVVASDNDKTVNKLAEIYSISAMACRRVKIKSISAKLGEKKEETKVEEKPTDIAKDPVVEKKEKLANPVKPQPTITTREKLKEGITKKVLRKLLSECDYFEVIKEENPMIYDSIKEKIKFFNPAFHSMTPEGLNSRITFLNQCVRPGETIPVIGTDGKPKFNDAVNTSFGAPPVLVLRVGDFYHTKIIPKNVSFSYEPLIYDINPEGIGVQPMLVNVTMSFDFIGGSGLAKPVEQLQNALSFNYYANTEIYDERSVWTEDTSALDKKLFGSILDGETTVTVKNVGNQASNNGGTTIGTIISTNISGSVETGDITYQKVMDKLIQNTKSYFENLINKLESINNNTDNGSYGLVQLFNGKKSKDTTEWEIKGAPDKMKIFGKSDFQPIVDDLFTAINTDIDNGDNIIILKLIDKNITDVGILQPIGINIQNYIKELKTNFSNNLATTSQEIVSNEITLVQNTREINLVNNLDTDGLLLSGNVPKVYNLSGTSIDNDGDYLTTNEQLNGDYIKLVDVISDFNELLEDEEIIFVDPEYGYNDNTFLHAMGSPIASVEVDYERRFFIVMSRIMTDKTRREDFLNKIVTNTIVEQGGKKVKNKTEDILKDISKDYEKVLEFYEKKFKKLKKDKRYLDLTDGIEEVLFKSGKERKYTYSTEPGPNKTNQENEIKDLYLNVPKFN